MREVPDPDEYEVQLQEFRREMNIRVDYPNAPFGVFVRKDGWYSNLNDMRKEEYDYDECLNCDEVALSETGCVPCGDCQQAALDAVEEWAEENTDELLGGAL